MGGARLERRACQKGDEQPLRNNALTLLSNVKAVGVVRVPVGASKVFSKDGVVT